MAAEQFFSMPPSTHIRISSSNSGFYDTVVDKKIFQYKYQLYAFAIMVALIRGAEPDTSTKNTDICLVGNVDEANFAVAKGLVAHISPDVKNGSELIKRMNEYADAGIAILKEDFEHNDSELELDQYLE